jgi:formylmethanofuran dehydrogenase subunit E
VCRKVSRKARKGATAQRNTAVITAPPLSAREIVFRAKPAEKQGRKENIAAITAPPLSPREIVFRVKPAEEQWRKEIPLRPLHRCYRCGKLYFNK